MQDLFFPKTCLNCHKEGRWLCESCSDSLFFIDSHFCPFCGNIGDLFFVCKSCRGATGIEKVFSLFKYNDPLARKIIKNFKYRYVKSIVHELEPIIRKFLLKYSGLIEKDGVTLLPVSLGWYKIRERGFNQAEELAKVIKKILNLEINTKILKKCGITRSQATLSYEERFNNLKGAFKVIKTPPKNVIIVDDVFTTGSTVKEVASVLKKAGTERIQIITFARG